MEGASSDTGPATHGRSYMFHWQISIWVSKDPHANINSFHHYPVYHKASCTLVNFSTWLAVELCLFEFIISFPDSIDF